MKVAIYGRSLVDLYKEDIIKLFKILADKSVDVSIYHKFKKDLRPFIEHIDKYPSFSNRSELQKNIDFFISIGGDGTILDTVTLVKDSKIPILGINTGRLGFLSNTQTDEVAYAVDCLLNNHFKAERRTLLEVNTTSNVFNDENIALNELSIVKRDTSSMITINTYMDGAYLNSYWGDGLIISTATGSTAYSLSCGGPIIMPGTGNIVITPIAPHNLNVRPIIISDSSVLTITIESRADQCLIALDSRSKIMSVADKIQLKKADYELLIVQLPNQSFISSLRNKLNWGLDRRNK